MIFYFNKHKIKSRIGTLHSVSKHNHIVGIINNKGEVYYTGLTVDAIVKIWGKDLQEHSCLLKTPH